MTTATGTEQEILAHYNLTSLYPEEWPSEKNEGESNEQDNAEAKAQSRHTRRFTILGQPRGSDKKGKSPHRGRGKDDALPPLPRDEPDPLGNSSSIVATLRRRGVPVEGNEELKNRFLLSSTAFSPGDYLTAVHNNTSPDELMRGLDTLTASIDEKSASLKKLVESNFERFVRAKATIDNVYTEMRNHGAEERPASRHTSWQNSMRTARALGPGFRSQPMGEKRKNALIQESEWGTAGVQGPLKEAAVKAQEVWGPALGGRDREEHLRSVLLSVESNKSIFETGAAIEDCIKRRDYDTLTEEYSRAQRFKTEAQTVASRARQSDTRLSDAQIHQLIITGRVLMDVDKRIEDFKRDTWKRLRTAHFSTGNETPDGKQEEYMELIAVLLQLGVEENPIWVWLQSRHEYLQKRILNNFQHVRVELELQRRNLLHTNAPSAKVLATHLRAAGNGRQANDNELDTRPVIRFWERQANSLSTLLSPKNNGLLGEVIEFWETAQAFVEGIKQRSLPGGPEGRSRRHHRLDRSNAEELKRYAIGLLETVREQLRGMFVDAPIDDVSAIFSPSTPTTKTPMSAVMSPLKNQRFTFMPQDIPPLPTQASANEPWASFAFWPPHSNALSASTYLSRLNNMIGTAAAEIVSLELVKTESSQLVPELRSLVGEIRERSISAICAAWERDSNNCRELEDWTRSPEKPDLTNLPSRFSAFESTLLANLQRIVYVPDAAQHHGSREVILPPPNKHIDAVQKGFKNSLYKSFAGMMEHAGRPAQAGTDGAEGEDEEDITVPLIREQTVGATGEMIDAANSNARKLLTISNFQTLRSDTIPTLISTFESSFSLTITDDAKVARDVLSQMHARVFQAYVRPTVEALRTVVTNGISSSNYASETLRPSDARPYVYDTLLALVLIHTEVSRTTPALTNQVLSYLLEQLSSALIDAFRSRTRYTLAALMQATLDVEFLAQTLDNYTTKKAGEIQGEIYQALDERTDNEARHQLQSGLPEMKAILKRLRERTKGEFGCFRRVRKRRGEDAER